MSCLLKNFDAVTQDLTRVCQDCGRSPDSVRLLAVSKTFPAQDVEELFQGRHHLAFGENRVQELKEKAPRLPRELQWHLIGHLQANKVRTALEYARWIHGVDTASLFWRIQDIAAQVDATPRLLLEVNVSGEESKFGFTPEDALALAREIGARPLQAPLAGLMTMAPFQAPRETLEKVFGGLRQLRDQLEQIRSEPLPELSMGMSGDYPEAIRQGATIVRIGTAIFGHR
ncbi:MAG: YggS family pyridoxal phosphate-dependent enzyme [Oligosphaeraceae bacterium]